MLPKKGPKGGLTILCTTNVIADTVGALTHPESQVSCLMGPGVDPHTYRAREHDMYLLLNADIIFYNGLHLEGKMADVLEKIKYRSSIVVALGEHIPPEILLKTDYENIYDPHIWHDVHLWKKVVKVIMHTLQKADPSHTEYYQEKASEYVKKLDDLHAYIQMHVHHIQPSHRFLITAHDAFQYFARAYGFKVVGLQGVSTDTEISPRDIHDLVQLIIEYKVPAIFVESSLPHRNIVAVMDAVRSRGQPIILGGELFSDALAGKNHSAETYIGMMKYNVETIISALTT